MSPAATTPPVEHQGRHQWLDKSIRECCYTAAYASVTAIISFCLTPILRKVSGGHCALAAPQILRSPMRNLLTGEDHGHLYYVPAWTESLHTEGGLGSRGGNSSRLCHSSISLTKDGQWG